MERRGLGATESRSHSHRTGRLGRTERENHSMSTEKEIFTTEEAAQMMGCAPSTIEEHARARVLPGVRMGHEWRFPREAFMKAINTLAVTGELHRESPKRKAKAVATDKDKGSKTNRRNPIPELPTLRSVG